VAKILVDTNWQKALNVWEYRANALYWQIKCGRGASVKRPGDKVNVAPDAHGYAYVTWRRKHYAVHRLVFLFVHRWLPDCVDHIDGNPQNNCVENLRAATRLQNQHNRRRNTRHQSGVKNVTPHQGKWSVRFSVGGKTRHFGCFDSLELAELVAQEVREKLHGDFARHA
jgi:hypothetical protein